MPVQTGENVNQFNTILHIVNGEPASQTVFRRPSINLENRTSALKIFVESLEDLFIEHDHTGDGATTPARLTRYSFSDINQPNGIPGLDAYGKVPSSVLPDSVLGTLQYQGVWDAAINNPAIPTASASNKGFYYVVGNSGSTNISGITDWKSPDWIVSNGSNWEKIDNSTEPRLQEIVDFNLSGKAGFTIGVNDSENGLVLIDTRTSIETLNTQVADLYAKNDTQYLQIAYVTGLVDATRRDLDYLLANRPLEETFPAVGPAGQTLFTASTIAWNADPAFLDIVVRVNGEPQVPGVDFTKVDGTSVQFSSPLPEDSVVTIRIELPKISIPLAGQPYFVNYVGNTTGMVVYTGHEYDPTKTRLGVFRNGLYMVNSPFVGGLGDRYTEQDRSSVLVGVGVEASDVFAFVNQDVTPVYKQVNSGLSGTVITVPSYTQGSNRLLVYRNGLLANSSGFGLLAEQYTESSPTSITLAASAVSTDWFTFEYRQSITWREDKTGVTGTQLLLTNPYTKGNGKLLVFRNGALLHNSTTLGTPDMRYTEYGTIGASSTRIDLEVAASTDDVFTFLYQ